MAFDYRVRQRADDALKDGHRAADQQSMTSIRKIASLLALTAVVALPANAQAFGNHHPHKAPKAKHSLIERYGSPFRTR